MRRNIIPKTLNIREFFLNKVSDIKIHSSHLDTLWDIHISQDRISFIEGAPGTGKTLVANFYVFYWAIHNPNCKIALASDFLEIVQQSACKFASLFAEYIDMVDKYQIILKNGSIIRFINRLDQLRGVEWSLIVFDECRPKTDWDSQEEIYYLMSHRARKIIKTRYARRHSHETYLKIKLCGLL